MYNPLNPVKLPKEFQEMLTEDLSRSQRWQPRLHVATAAFNLFVGGEAAVLAMGAEL